MENIMVNTGNGSSHAASESVELDEEDDELDSETTSSTLIESYNFINHLVADGMDDEDNPQDQGGGGGGDEEDNVPSSNDVKLARGQRKRDRKAAKLKKEQDKELAEESPAELAAQKAARTERRRKVNDDYVAELRHKGLHTLSGEIDRCLKKVTEGVETFEDIWQKVHNATNTNQKEKYEADLKKEIKKLQRLRDQIKSWIASGEIKDKSTLVETRKLIETQMERFKVVERETKTKAYSKEGLGAAQKLDPTTKEREDLNNWLISSIDAMQIQIDQFESEVESILAAKKKRLDKDKQDRLDELKTAIDRHRFHVGKLETLMRMLDNLAADVNALRTFLSQVKKIKDDIEYYLDSNQEPEFEENEFIYDDIDGLDEFDEGLVNQIAGAGGVDEEGVLLEVEGSPITSIMCTSGNNSPISPVHSSDASDPEKRRKSSDDSSTVVRPVAMMANQTNHSPSPGIKTVGAVGTPPPKGVGTPNNSSPSSGLSNHVSSLSSLSSSPTHNFHNALNNSKSLAIVDSTDNNNASTTGGLISKSPAVIANSILGTLDGIATVNGVLENGNGSPTEDHSHVTSTSNTSSLIGSSVTLENGLPSPPPVQESTTNNGTIGSDRSHQLFGESLSLETSSSQPVSSFLQQSFNGLAATGVSNNLSEGFGLNLGVSSSSTLISSTNCSGSNSSSVLGGSSNVIGLPSILGSIQQNSATGDVSSSLVNPSSTPTTPSAIHGGVSTFETTNNSNSLSASSAVSSHNNSSSSVITQQHVQLQQLHQGPTSQSGGNMDPTPMSDYLRLPSQDQILINRILNNEPESMASLKSMAQEVLDRSGLSLTDHSKNMLESKTREAHIPPLLGVAPLGPVPLQKEHQHQFQMMDSAHSHLPYLADSERMRQFLPRNPYPTPHYYPQHPLSNSDSFEFFNRLSIETLFFIFYYLEGTKAQYLAAKVLKKQSWRFHTKYMMWFQRHEEPKVINDEFEQGTYVYFDIEKWGQRKKDGFVFEYRYLEDRDLG